MMQRTTININQASGTAVITDTGPVLVGELVQIRWDPTEGHAASTLALEQMLAGASDTGDSYRFITATDLSAQFVKCPRQALHDAAGSVFDTGGAREPVYWAGEKLRIRLTPGDTGHAVAGNLHIWMRNPR